MLQTVRSLAWSILFAAQVTSTSDAAAQDVEVAEIRVVDETDAAVNGKVYREPHSGGRQLIGPAIEGRVNRDGVVCDEGEFFTADSDQSGYTQIYLGTEKCRENVVIVLAAPQTVFALAFLADNNLEIGDAGLAAVQFAEAQARVSFDIKLEDGNSLKTFLALKSYQSLEAALGQKGLYAITENGWPVLNQAGSQALAKIQKDKGLTETGQFDLNAYKALTNFGLNRLIMQAYQEQLSVELEGYKGKIGLKDELIKQRERIG